MPTMYSRWEKTWRRTEPRATTDANRGDVSFGSLADILTSPRYVRFTCSAKRSGLTDSPRRNANRCSVRMLDDYSANFGLGDEGAGDQRLPPIALHASAAAKFLNVVMHGVTGHHRASEASLVDAHEIDERWLLNV